MKKWNMMAQFKKQAEQDIAVSERFNKRVSECLEAQTVARTQYEELLRQEATEGKDLTAEKKAARQAMKDADEELSVARYEQQKAYEYHNTQTERINALSLRLERKSSTCNPKG